MSEGFIAALILAALTFMGGCYAGKRYYHEQLCVERFANAATAADSLNVAQEDALCAKLLTWTRKPKP